MSPSVTNFLTAHTITGSHGPKGHVNRDTRMAAWSSVWTPASSPAIAGAEQILPARNLLRGLADFLGDDDHVHDDHYDWQSHRGQTSRKDRIRDVYRMQQDAQKDY